MKSEDAVTATTRDVTRAKTYDVTHEVDPATIAVTWRGVWNTTDDATREAIYASTQDAAIQEHTG